MGRMRWAVALLLRPMGAGQAVRASICASQNEGSAARAGERVFGFSDLARGVCPHGSSGGALLHRSHADPT